jgi:uncharacterized membrane-anchored protein
LTHATILGARSTKGKRMYRSTWAAIVVLLVTSTAAHSQGAASDPAAARQEFIDKVRALAWVRGPTTVAVEGNSKLLIPDQYVFLDASNTTRFLELQHNLGDGREVMVAPANMEWMAYLEFSDEGYVKDNEKIDAVALLKSLQENTEAGNEQRRSRGWSELRLIDWATPPVYNTTTKRLEWATVLDSKEGRAVNFSTKILGRHGFTTVIMVTDPVNLDAAQSSLDHVLSGYAFNSGETYADWRSGDKVARYGLAALIVGGVAAVAAKKGLFSVLAGFLAAAWKFIMVGVVAAVAWVRKLFAKKPA